MFATRDSAPPSSLSKTEVERQEAERKLLELKRRRNDAESEELEKMKQKQQGAEAELEELKKKREERKKILEEEEKQKKQELEDKKAKEQVRMDFKKFIFHIVKAVFSERWKLCHLSWVREEDNIFVPDDKA